MNCVRSLAGNPEGERKRRRTKRRLVRNNKGFEIFDERSCKVDVEDKMIGYV